MFGLLLALWSSPAEARPQRGEAPVDASVRTGDDLSAWRAVDSEDADALRAFIESYPTSPLAELALRELAELEDAPPELSPVERARLEASLEEHDNALQRQASVVYVAPSSVGPAPVGPHLRPTLELGWTSGMHVYMAGGVHRGWTGLTLRTVAGADQPLSLDLSLRVSPWTRAGMSPYAELIGALRTPALSAAVGVAQPLRRDFAMNIALEGTVVGAPFTPTLRVGMLKAF